MIKKLLCLLLLLLITASSCGAATSRQEYIEKKLYSTVLSLVHNSYIDGLESWTLFIGSLRGMNNKLGNKRLRLELDDNKVVITYADGEQLVVDKLQINNNDIVMLDTMASILNHLMDEEASDDDRSAVIYAALEGLVDTLDPHSEFIPPEKFAKLKSQNRGIYTGIGVEVTIKKNKLTVVSPFEDTPADKAGFRALDQITRIDGEPTEGVSLLDAVEKLRGPIGTPITVTLLKKNTGREVEITLNRDSIPLDTVRPKLLAAGLGYIRISRFLHQTTPDMYIALEDLSSKYQLKGLIIDLRNNPGGLLGQAISVADIFLEDGTIVFTKGRIKGRNMKFMAKYGRIRFDFPLIMLINEGSASGTEILASALRENNKGIIIGTRSFGKGSIQTVFPVEGGSALRLTSAKFFTPNGTEIQEYGITPDLIARMDEEEREVIREEDLESALAGNPEALPTDVPTLSIKYTAEGDPILDLAEEIFKVYLDQKMDSLLTAMSQVYRDKSAPPEDVAEGQPGS